MDKYVEVLVEKFKHKYKITLIVDHRGYDKCEKFYSILRLYSKHTKRLNTNGLLLNKATWQFNHKHIAGFEVKDLNRTHEFLTQLSAFNYVDIKFI
mgnify:CR=1 FL=1